eukprot:TRINITY_DN97615_c0_g1_i1.p1 TRINITY_DN97615_c0_g1~~TRINITY_DN97615_c0_g1_i1.p1  ORF type:complete len:467 (+),score=49.61 TRINITY_DN97615_c0_g1_i1:31-1401(+)
MRGWHILVSYFALSLAAGGLYDATSAVVHLDEVFLDGKKEQALAQSCLVIAEYYSSWCGHCQNFAPTYSELARRAYAEDLPAIVSGLDCAKFPSACAERSVRLYPTLVLFYPGEDKPRNFDSRQRTLEALLQSIRTWQAEASPGEKQVEACRDHRQRLLQGRTIKNVAAPGTRPRPRVTVAPPTYSRDHLPDIIYALHLTLTTEVPLHPELRGTSLGALKGFVRALSLSLPTHELRRFFKTVDVWLQARGLLTSQEWLDQWQKKWNFSTLWQDMRWHACIGSAPQYRGFPCGLWTAYHSVVVNAPANAKQNALFAVIAYVRTFFTCQFCRDHFTALSADADSLVKTDAEAILWLWRAHNAVNLRLNNTGSKSTDPLVPKLQFPPMDLCSRCRSTVGTNDSASTWNDGEVLRFLIRFYTMENQGVRAPFAASTMIVLFAPVASVAFVGCYLRRHRKL